MHQNKMKVHVIESSEQFRAIFPILKDDARVRSTPDLYLVGLDTEYISKSSYPHSFKHASSWVLSTPSDVAVCVIQLASENVCMVIHCVKLRLPLPKKLLRAITSESWMKVGVGVELDLFHLSNNYRLGHCAGGVEIKNLALLAKYKRTNLEYLYNTLSKKAIQKPQSMCNWTEDLTSEKIKYAANDAIMSYQIFKEIMKPSLKALMENKYTPRYFSFDIVRQTPIPINYVGKLNEWAQHNKKLQPVYEVESKDGVFETICFFENLKTVGMFKSKKTSKQLAAKEMYHKIL